MSRRDLNSSQRSGKNFMFNAIFVCLWQQLKILARWSGFEFITKKRGKLGNFLCSTIFVIEQPTSVWIHTWRSGKNLKLHVCYNLSHWIAPTEYSGEVKRSWIHSKELGKIRNFTFSTFFHWAPINFYYIGTLLCYIVIIVALDMWALQAIFKSFLSFYAISISHD